MRIWNREAEFDLGSCVAALGTFDGVHIGHQVLIRRAMAMAKQEGCACVVCTFDRHPLVLLKPEFAPVPLMTLEEKLEKLAALGVDGVLLRPFDREFAGIEAADYLEMLRQEMHVRGIVTGFNYSFGAGGRGNADLIRSHAERLGYRAEIVAAVQDGGDVVSSTLIRRLIAEGDHARAARLMRISSVKL